MPLYEIWYGDLYITTCYKDEASVYVEAGYRAINISR